VCGDFNIIRFSSEKNKNFQPNKFTDLFNIIINSNELREIDISGGIFTWSNNQTSPSLEKLDIILMTKEWEIKFPNVQVYKAPREMPNHCPLFLCTHSNSEKKLREFQFELAWLKDPQFLSRVRET
jgi:hypothetical protein